MRLAVLAASVLASACALAAPKTEVMFFFDAEDYTSDRPNDALRDLANLFTEEGARVHVALVGYLAHELERYGRKDVVAALRPHVMGTQSMYHSKHPNVLELADGADYEAAYRRVWAEEEEGVRLIRRVTGKEPIFAVPPGGSKSYVAMDVYADLGLRFYCDTVCATGNGGNWFSNLRHFDYEASMECLIPTPGETPKPIDWKSMLDGIAARPRQILYLHPCMAVNRQFWDGVNYNKTNACEFGKWKLPQRRAAADTQLYYARLRELIRRLKADGRFTFPTLEEKIAEELPRTAIHMADVKRLAAHMDRGIDAVESPSWSVADVFVASVKFLRGETVHEPGRVHGFLERPFAIERPVTLKVSDLKAAAKTIDLSGFLPASIGVGGTRIGPGDFLRAALHVLADGSETVTVCPSDPLAALARFPRLRKFHPAGTWVFWPEFKDEFTSDRLRYQVWTWRPSERAAVTRTVELKGWEFRREGGAWERVRVPHDWAIAGPFDKEVDKQVVAIVENGEKVAKEKTGRTGSLPFIGKGEYRTTVTVPAGTGYAALVFDGVMSEPEVFCDGVKVGEWKHGYNAFEVELPTKAGAYEVVVKATNRPESSRWYPGAGIIRPVKLVLGNETGVKTWGNAVWCPDLGTVRVKTECRGTPGRIAYRILDGEREVAASDSDELKGAFVPWSPENPKLYTLVTEVYAKDGSLADRKEERIGVRTLKYGDGKFLLNGTARKFKGVCLHHDLGPLGAAFDKDAFRRQMTLLKEMGCDSLRTSHNMPGEGQLEVCDELGIMVMAESFDSWHLAKVKNGYNLFFDDWWKRDIRNLVEKCRNHPSVVMWSIGNEVYEQNTDDGAALARALQAECHKYDRDPGRKVTQGLSWMPNAIEKGLNAVMDIPAVTYRLPFYEAMYKDTKSGIVLGAETASTISSRGEYFFPVVETNCPAHANLQCSSYDVEWTPWSNLPDDDWATQDDHPWTIGEFVWTGFDYLGEPYPYDESWPSRSAYFGIFDLAGLPKDRYWLYRSHWNTASHTLHLVPHWSFPDRVGQVTPVYCYTDFDEAELFVNGKSQGRRRKDPKSRLDRYRLRWNEVVYQPGELKVVAYGKDGKPALTETVRTAGKAARVKLEKRRFGELLFVTATIVDEKGILVPDADDELSFTCGKNLKFVAICNGDATSTESFVVPHMKAFHGQLVAIFRGTGDEVECKR